jgi:phosphoenolpyruvate synthase/pyruvate phosphate dikinase
MSEKQPEQPKVVAEFKELGHQLTATIKAVAGSEHLRSLSAELRDGLKEATQEVEETFAKLRASDDVQRLRERAADVAQSFKTGEAQREIREEVIDALRALNLRLSELRERIQPHDQPETPPQQPEEPYTGETRRL